MSLQMTIREFEEVNLFSNKNIERMASTIVNESSNAVLVSMFEDNVILLDHEKGQFYMAEYTFDNKKATFVFENFQPIDLEKENDTFTESVSNFFDDEDASITSLTESYKKSVMGQDQVIREIINEAIATKDFDEVIDYSEVADLNEDVSIKDKPYFKKYAERLITHPINEARYFNWESPVVVSLMETEKKKLINSTVVEKAAELWKRESFKKMFTEAAETFIEDVEEGKEMFIELFEEFPQLFFLDSADRKTLFGKSIISSSVLREELNDLQKGLEILFEDEEISEMRDEYLSEADDDEEEETDDEDEDEEDEEEDEEPEELTPEQISEIVNELKKLAEKIEDEKLKEKMDDIIAKLDTSVEEGTRPALVKDAIYLLSI